LWFDAHNASAAYHNILLRELLELFRALPAQHEFRPVVRDALTRGLDQAAAETLAKGYAGTWTDNFARGLQWIGKNDRWRRALNVNLNASERNGAPSPGVRHRRRAGECCARSEFRCWFAMNWMRRRRRSAPISLQGRSQLL
jgi:hypothetical protein